MCLHAVTMLAACVLADAELVFRATRAVEVEVLFDLQRVLLGEISAARGEERHRQHKPGRDAKGKAPRGQRHSQSVPET